MKLYGGMDLHSTNVVTQLIDEGDKVLYRKKQSCDLDQILKGLEPFKDNIEGIAVESTYNWYWLVDGLMAAGYRVHLVNTAAVKQYEGLKYTDDDSDAFWLAHLLRLGILPTGHIYPKESRGVRDLLRKRGQLVRQRTAHILSIENLYARNSGDRLSCNAIKCLTEEQIQQQFADPNVALAIDSNRILMNALDQQIKVLEQALLKQTKLNPRYRKLLTIDGVGEVLALTITLETGDIGRFAQVGNFTSYCRCVGSEKLSNGKKKGQGNSKNGNKYLAWAFVEAANFAIRFNEQAKRFYQRKAAKRNRVVALKAVAHKLARASYYVMRDQVPFDSTKLFV
ncbi:MAG: IS110 family transposase [Methylococcaceae bacterium]|jgi:transposase|nr:IS110 family transposase [Methylococcaceae bacterium]OYV22467.1 MAG: putative transposase, IS116/IS110/IS902 family [Methylococcaceae bacterium NSO1]